MGCIILHSQNQELEPLHPVNTQGMASQLPNSQQNFVRETVLCILSSTTLLGDYDLKAQNSLAGSQKYQAIFKVQDTLVVELFG